MNYCSKIFLFLFMVVISCGPKLVPVSNTDHQTVKTDSTRIQSHTKKDSSFYRETVEEKILPGAVTGITLTANQWDSLVSVIGQLPKGVPVYMQDPQLKAQLRFLRDSLGRFRIECAALDQKYFQRTIEQGHFIQRLESELVSKNSEIEKLREQILQKQECKGVAFWKQLGYRLWWLWLLLGIAAATFVYSKLAVLKKLL